VKLLDGPRLGHEVSLAFSRRRVMQIAEFWTWPYLRPMNRGVDWAARFCAWFIDPAGSTDNRVFRWNDRRDFFWSYGLIRAVAIRLVIVVAPVLLIIALVTGTQIN
jgi:hypothetical protein